MAVKVALPKMLSNSSLGFLIKLNSISNNQTHMDSIIISNHNATRCLYFTGELNLLNLLYLSFLFCLNLDESGDSSVVAVAITGLQVDIGGGASTPRTGSLNGLELGRLGALSVKVALAGDMARGGSDDATEVGVRGGEAGGLVGKLSGASDVRGLERVVIVVDSGLADHIWWPVSGTTCS